MFLPTRFYQPTAALGGVVARSEAYQAIADEANGLALSFTDDFFLSSTSHYGSARVKDTGTPGNAYNSHPFGLLTYSSPSVKLCRGPDGNLRYGAHNLCLQSEDITSLSWQKLWGTSPAPDQFRETAETQVHGVRQLVDFADGGYAFTLELVGVGRTKFRLIVETGNAFSNRTQINLDLEDDTADITNFGTYTGTAVTIGDADGDGYKRITVTGDTGAKGGAGNVWWTIYSRDDDGNTSFLGETDKGFNIRKIHVRRLPSDPAYLKTTSAAAYELPFEWDTDGNLLGIRVEEQRTNKVLWNRDLSNAAWIKRGTGSAAKTATGVDGIANSASALTGLDTSGNDVYQAPTGFTPSAAIAASVYLQRVSTSGVLIIANAINKANGEWRVDLSQLSDEWERITDQHPAVTVIAAFSATEGGAAGLHFHAHSGGPLAVNVDLCQLEEASFVTSPIETAGSTVTRAADNISLATSAFPFSGVAGTIFVEVIRTNNSGGLVLINDGTSNNFISMATRPGQDYNDFVVFSGGNSQADMFEINTGTVAAGPYKQAGAYAEDDFIYYAQGEEMEADTDGTPPSSVTTMRLGFERGNRNLNGHLKSLLYLPRRMANTELQEITA